jgi:hypothetical protein
MPTYNFVFTNSNGDQVFQYLDELAQATTVVGPVNNGTSSSVLQCWVGSNGNGRIVLTGSQSGNLAKDIPEDNFQFSY